MSRDDPRVWFWAEALELMQLTGQRRGRVLSSEAGALPTWEPPVDVIETNDAVRVTVALPGVPPESVEIRAEGAALLVRGLRALPAESRHGAIRRLEIPYGRFERRIGLPSLPLQLSEQFFRDGCLHLVLRRVRSPMP